MIKPLTDYLLIKKEVSKEEKKVGAIVIQTSKKDDGNVATIVAVGPEVKNKDLTINTKVVYKEYSTTKYNENDEEFFLIKEENILAIVE